MNLKMLRKFLAALLVFTAVAPALSANAQDNMLRVQIDVEVASLDPQIATDGTSIEVITAFVDGLVEIDANNEIVPAIAESYEVNEDETVYTFKLREDANWSNGEPVTANDFVYSWQRLVNPDTASEYSFIADTASILNAAEIAAGEMDKEELGAVAVDDKTLEVTLSRPTPYFLNIMSFVSFLPVNQAFFESTDGQFATSPDTTLANGAFVVSDYQPAATHISLTKNPDYYNGDAITLDGLEFQVIKDSQQAVLAYQTDQIDVAAIAGEQVDLYAADPEFTTADQGYLWFVSPNNQHEDLSNVNLRLALGKAFDREVITNNILKDGSTPADFFIPQNFSVSPDGVDYREDAGTGLLSSDAAAAVEHYETAKEELGKDSFEFGLLVEDTESAINVAQSLEAQIEQTLPGVDIQLEQMPKKTRLDTMRAGDFDLGLTRWGPDYADPTTYLQLLVSDSSYNDANYSNETFDAGYEEVMTGDLVNDPDARWEKMKELEKIAMEEAAVLPVYQASSALLIKSNVDGISFHAVGTPRVFKYATKQ